MKTATFPLRVRMSSAALTELHSCEYGSYEDHIHTGEICESCGSVTTVRDEQYADGRLHIIELIERGAHKTVVILKNQIELDEFYCAALTGTFGLYHCGVALRIFDELHEYVSSDRSVHITRGSIGY